VRVGFAGSDLGVRLCEWLLDVEGMTDLTDSFPVLNRESTALTVATTWRVGDRAAATGRALRYQLDQPVDPIGGATRSSAALDRISVERFQLLHHLQQ
jgi:hypothetical protein